MKGAQTAIQKPGNPWAQISGIAARVGVAPQKEGDPAAILAEGADGKHYDVMRVVSATLDRIDGGDIRRLREAIALCAGNARPLLGEGGPAVSVRRDLFYELLAAFNELRAAD